jgi:chemotaxis protein CheY-P-specific phosphatase CheC
MNVEKMVKSTDDILLILCKSVQRVLEKASGQQIIFSPIVQKIQRTCLKPDIGCFTIFEGGLSGLLILNFSAAAALDIYRSYMTNMGIPEDELSILHTSDDVANVLGELMNQAMGHFQTDLRQKLHVSITQNQPKMLVINKDISISIDTQIDDPQYRRVSFETGKHRPFFLELGIEKTTFETLFPFEEEEQEDIEDIFIKAQQEKKKEEG